MKKKKKITKKFRIPVVFTCDCFCYGKRTLFLVQLGYRLYTRNLLFIFLVPCLLSPKLLSVKISVLKITYASPICQNTLQPTYFELQRLKKIAFCLLSLAFYTFFVVSSYICLMNITKSITFELE